MLENGDVERQIGGDRFSYSDPLTDISRPGYFVATRAGKQGRLAGIEEIGRYPTAAREG